MKKWKIAVLISASIFWGAGSQAQYHSDMQIGGIVNAMLEHPGKDASPISTGGDLNTFRTNISLLLNYPIDDRIGAFATIETWQGFSLSVYAMGLHWRPWPGKSLQLLAGKFLAPFGNFLERRWASTNPLIGTPAAYNYYLNLSPRTVPETNATLLRARGQGHSLAYGAVSLDRGMRLLNNRLYLTGLQLFGESGKWRYALALANGALSNPTSTNPGDALHVLARFVFLPNPALVMGTSMSRGIYIERGATEAHAGESYGSAEQFYQLAFSVDMNFSFRKLQLWSEYLWNRYAMPQLPQNLALQGWSVEIKQKISARYYFAGRFSGLRFGEIADIEDVDQDGRLSEPWEYALTRYEVTLGYRLHRNSYAKASYQHNVTYGNRAGDPADDLAALQLAIFF